MSDRVRETWSPRVQLSPQLDVVVDLAVIGDDVSTARIGHRLRAEVQIDDGQTPVTKRERRLTPESLHHRDRDAPVDWSRPASRRRADRNCGRKCLLSRTRSRPHGHVPRSAAVQILRRRYWLREELEKEQFDDHLKRQARLKEQQAKHHEHRAQHEPAEMVAHNRRAVQEDCGLGASRRSSRQ